MACKICDTRKPRRFCPGVDGDICSVCCGEEREVTVRCPFECPYLRQAREREPLRAFENVPNSDVEISESFLARHEPILLALGSILSSSALEIDAATDVDVREAIAALIRTYRTLRTGLVYESRPSNPYAGHIFERVQEAVAGMRSNAQRTGAQAPGDSVLLGLFVFLERLALQNDNERPRGRRFLQFLGDFFPGPPVPASPPPGIVVP